jgi:hypothetical protein
VYRDRTREARTEDTEVTEAGEEKLKKRLSFGYCRLEPIGSRFPTLPKRWIGSLPITAR